VTEKSEAKNIEEARKRLEKIVTSSKLTRYPADVKPSDSGGAEKKHNK
jgi:hypothetical protein